MLENVSQIDASFGDENGKLENWKNQFIDLSDRKHLMLKINFHFPSFREKN
jgi:hypothetical protein